MSQRGAARYFGIDPRTVAKMMRFSVPPGYRRSRPPARPKLDPFTGIIDQILDDDGSIAAKQRHTAKRIFERLRDEHGYGGGYTTVKDYVRVRRQQRREVFVPLWHPAGHGQADFGEAVAVIGGVAQKVHLFVMDLPQSDAGFVKAYPGRRPRPFSTGTCQHSHSSAACRGRSCTTTPSWRWRGSRRRQAAADPRLQRADVALSIRGSLRPPWEGQRQGQGRDLVGYARRNYLVPLPRAATFEELNAQLEARCRRRFDDRLRGHDATIGTRLAADQAAFLDLPAVPYEPCEKRPGRVSSLSLVRYRNNDYSVPTAYGHRAVLIRGYVDRVEIVCGSEQIACHRRSYAREDFVFDPLHYLALLEQKPGALDQAAPLAGLATARWVRCAASVARSPLGQGWQAGVRAGSASVGSVPA